MNSKITTCVFFLFFLSFSTAQSTRTPDGGGEVIFNSENRPCVTPEQRNKMINDVQTSIAKLRRENRLSFSHQRGGNHPFFIWPVQKANNITFNEIYTITAYVDHNTEFPNQLTDYTGGARTYDTNAGYNHEGTDIATWPFGWQMMDNDGVEIIAAAPGQIIINDDGAFDRSCDFNTTTPWNLIVIQHNDGSVAAYGHIKNGSTTTKNVGDMVVAGEYLGIVGSSGISTGPHLHFEVLTDETFTEIIDPYFGTSNSTVSESWWMTQRPYNSAGINAVLTHSAAPDVFPPCPTSETPNLRNDFNTDDDIYFTVFVRDQTLGDIINFEILRPDNTSLFDEFSATATTTAYTWYYLFGPYNGYFDMVGEWKWRATFGGETVTHTFNVTNTLSVDKIKSTETSIYPNPFSTIVNINSTTKINKVSIVDILGEKVLMINEKSDNGIKALDLPQLSNGLYFAILEGDYNYRKMIKLLKK
ncbi:peptidoglycan DD-metalloendopeptidase family protein [Winogradskyella bathintestinalis]|uniref:Peptidoglycan DD-metalloendopeptidase family protein n=1 Tax=Winogradskyella bathintestinalis TaxID=3035208 RepID=A0ABT7ZRN8_9FLAO|nr:peptidoglycan DD-metalloendopeptidase family protein [Winogradskyella bathintestinalis]MDN3491647.1 peptidoglycan DD-metalloendopeptidase family protein [Winogradskyella bathintestinalis]